MTHAITLCTIDLYQHLEEAEFLADRRWTDDEQRQARATLAQLAEVVHSVIVAHAAVPGTEEYLCRACGTPWPCPTTSTVHAQLSDDGGAIAALLDRSRDTALAAL